MKNSVVCSIPNHSLKSYEAMQQFAHTLLDENTQSVLLQSNQVDHPLFCQDYWTNGHESFWLVNKRWPTSAQVAELSDAIDRCLGLGYSIKDALVIANMHINRSIRQQCNLPFSQNNWPEEQIDLPYLSQSPLNYWPQAFKPCPLGLYPVVDRSHWLEQLLPLGVKTIQLRIKDLQGAQLEEEIKRAVELAKQYAANLFVNDYWELAIQLGANGVHLGQEDLPSADIAKIHQSGLYLGISTHCYYEVAIAHRFNPSYIACGPIYSTTSKTMGVDPQGLENLKRWRSTLQYPLVAIGGINLQRLQPILDANVEGISLISAITQAQDPALATQEFLKRIDEHTHE